MKFRRLISLWDKLSEPGQWYRLATGAIIFVCKCRSFIVLPAWRVRRRDPLQVQDPIECLMGCRYKIEDGEAVDEKD